MVGRSAASSGSGVRETEGSTGWAAIIGAPLWGAAVAPSIPCGARGAEVGMEVLEPPHAEERVAQDEQGPAVAHDGEGARHRAGHVADVLPPHWAGDHRF